MNRPDLADSLKGCPYANVTKLATEHFTPEFLRNKANGLWHTFRMTEGFRGLKIEYRPSELDKVIVHHVSREITADLWAVAEPTLRDLLDSNGRFKLETAIPRFLEPLGTNLERNFATGNKFIYDMNLGLYKKWLENVPTQDTNGDMHPKVMNLAIYRSHSALINGGDMSIPTVIETTFTATGKEYFKWLRDYPDLSRAELEEIVDDSLPQEESMAKQMGIKSTAREDVLRKTNELFFIFDPSTRKIIQNPALAGEVKAAEEQRKPDYHDQTNLQINCPAIYVPSTLYRPNGSVLKDLLKFRAGMYVELYLQTHDRR